MMQWRITSFQGLLVLDYIHKISKDIYILKSLSYLLQWCSRIFEVTGQPFLGLGCILIILIKYVWILGHQMAKDTRDWPWDFTAFVHYVMSEIFICYQHRGLLSAWQWSTLLEGCWAPETTGVFRYLGPWWWHIGCSYSKFLQVPPDCWCCWPFYSNPLARLYSDVTASKTPVRLLPILRSPMIFLDVIWKRKGTHRCANIIHSSGTTVNVS